jgi:hypothetical protein
MRLATKRTLSAIASVLTVAGLVIANGNAASAASNSIPYTPKVSFSMSDAGGFEFPTALHAGYVTLIGSTTDTTYHALQGFRTKNGATVDQVIEDLRLGVAGATLEEAALGHQQLLHDATLVGGVVATLRGPVSVTIPLENGTYTFFDVNDIFLGIPPRLHTVKVWGTFRSSPLPVYYKTIEATMNAQDEPRFVAPLNMSANHTSFRAIVTMDEIHEFVLRPTLDGITNDYLTEYYTAVRDGTPRPPAPWKLTSTGSFERSAGLQAMSPNRWAIVQFNWDPGPYALLCLVPSEDNGQPHAYIGMHNIINLFA